MLLEKYTDNKVMLRNQETSPWSKEAKSINFAELIKEESKGEERTSIDFLKEQPIIESVRRDTCCYGPNAATNSQQ